MGHGLDAVPPDNPIRESYNFIGWDKSYKNITANVKIKAKYSNLFYDIPEFEDIYYGYESNIPTEVKLEKYGGEDIKNISISSQKGYFDVVQPELKILDDFNNSTSFYISLKNGLSAGVYEDNIIIHTENNEDRVMSIKQEVKKADVKNISFASREFIYDKLNKSLSVTGDLPEGVTIDYINNSRVNVGEYNVTAIINGGNNYNSQENSNFEDKPQRSKSKIKK